MKGPAGSRALLALFFGVMAAAMMPSRAIAATSGRFVPRDPGFVVANIAQTLPDSSLRELLDRWRAAPESEDAVVALARAFIERARERREPRYFGRAEALLQDKAGRSGAGPAVRLLYAETLQFRHAFAPAEAILDALLREQPHDGESRLRRGSLRLTRGDFAGARADCAQLALVPARGTHSALATVGLACLAEALAGSGDLTRARLLLDAMAGDAGGLDPAARAYLLTTRAELDERAGDITRAIGAYREASRLAPHDDAIRSALSDALALQADPGASAPLEVENPSLALLVRQAALNQESHLFDRARDWLALESARGDAIHHREAAILALAENRRADALLEARRNFQSQRELADVRVLARAIVAAGDLDTRRMLIQWLASTGYQDAVTAAILASKPRG